MTHNYTPTFTPITSASMAPVAETGSAAPAEAKKLSAVVTRGPNKGTVMDPYRDKNSFFLVSKGSNLRIDATEVSNEADLPSWVALGYGVRMSAKGIAPSLFMPKGLIISST